MDNFSRRGPMERTWTTMDMANMNMPQPNFALPPPPPPPTGPPSVPSPSPHTQMSGNVSPVELQVSNLDQAIDQRDMKRIISNLFSSHVMTLHVSVFFQTDGNMAACVRVASVNDAQVAISKLHRTKIGYKRILISYSNTHTQNPLLLRSKVFNLLSEVPNGRLQLFKFREMFEKRYHSSIGVSDLYKMKEIVHISEDGSSNSSGRMVQLHASLLAQHPQQQVHLQLQQMPSYQGQSFCGGTRPASSSSVMLPAPTSSAGSLDLLEASQCAKHAPQSEKDKVGWAEKENGSSLPLVNISLQIFGPMLRKVIKSHGGSVPLSTIVHCYQAEVDDLDDSSASDCNKREYDLGLDEEGSEEDGVPMEHLITCVKGVQIHHGVTGVKTVAFSPGYDIEDALNSSHSGSSISLPSLISSSGGGGNGSNNMDNNSAFPYQQQQQQQQQSVTSPNAALAGQLSLFSRELVDLLKSQFGCRMPFHKFIPSYHHYFGRQCRVADYGYTKLKDLFEALPHVVQILGEGARAAITLAHRAQLKRFTCDLLKVLKSQPTKQLSLLDLPPVYEKLLGRPFRITDYGVCDVEDLLLEISETSVVLSGSGDDMTVSIPKREQTLDEVEKTHQFASECIELLRHAPDCRLPFNKFIPSYHHHFGRQCRVADYGFSKLIELFEAVPGTVEVTEDADGERLLQLTDSERIQAVGEHISKLIASYSEDEVPIDKLSEMYKSQYGYQLRPENLGFNNLVTLLKSLGGLFRVDSTKDPVVVKLIDKSYIKAMTTQVTSILFAQDDGQMEVQKFQEAFEKSYDKVLDIEQLAKDLPDMVEILEDKEANNNNNNNEVKGKGAKEVPSSDPTEKSNGKAKIIRLAPLQLCAARVDQLIKDYKGKLYVSDLEAAFSDKYNKPLCPGQFGYHSANSLIHGGLSKHFMIRGRGAGKMIVPVRESNVGTTYVHHQGPFTFPPPAMSGPSSSSSSSSASLTSTSNPRSGGGAGDYHHAYPSYRPGGGRAVTGGGRYFSSYASSNYHHQHESSGRYSSPYPPYNFPGHGFYPSYPSGYSSPLPTPPGQQYFKFSSQTHDGLRMVNGGTSGGGRYHYNPPHHSHHYEHQAGGYNYGRQNYFYEGSISNNVRPFDHHHHRDGYLRGSLGGQYSLPPPPPPPPTPANRSPADSHAGSFNEQSYLSDLAQFGIFPSSRTNSVTASRAVPNNNNNNSDSNSSSLSNQINNLQLQAHNSSSRLSTSPAIGSPITAPGEF